MSRLHEEVARSLMDEIVSGRSAAGDWLPRELDLAARFAVSRGVVRETIHSLRLRGVVEVRHGRGARVLPEERWNLLDADVLLAVASAPGRRALLGEVLECRRTLEAEAAALAAERAGERDVAALGETLAHMRDAAPARTPAPAELPGVRAEARFHDELVALAGNRPLRRMLEPVHLALALARHEHAPGRRAASLRRHEGILDAVAARDPDAARAAVRAHADELAGWLA